jgi:tetratricopeptide (TPR) repeat protein
MKKRDFEGARKNYERALAIDEEVRGSNHPNVAISLSNLGDVLLALGDIEGARDNYQRALRIFREVLGDAHPMTVQAKKVLDAVGDTEESGDV